MGDLIDGGRRLLHGGELLLHRGRLLLRRGADLGRRRVQVAVAARFVRAKSERPTTIAFSVAARRPTSPSAVRSQPPGQVALPHPLDEGHHPQERPNHEAVDGEAEAEADQQGNERSAPDRDVLGPLSLHHPL